jgi:hypothetical protein
MDTNRQGKNCVSTTQQGNFDEVEALGGGYVHRWFAIDRNIKANAKIMLLLSPLEVKAWLYLMASTNNEGALPETSLLRWPLFPECSFDQLLQIIDRFKSPEVRLIDEVDGVLKMHDFGDYQPVGNRTKSGRKRESSEKIRVRVQEWRERKKAVQAPVPGVSSGLEGVNLSTIHHGSDTLTPGVTTDVTTPVTTDVTTLERERDREKTTTTPLPPLTMPMPVRVVGEDALPKMDEQWQERFDWLMKNYLNSTSSGNPQTHLQTFHSLIGLPAPKDAIHVEGAGFPDIAYFDYKVKPAVLKAKDSERWAPRNDGTRRVENLTTFLVRRMWMLEWKPSAAVLAKKRSDAAMPVFTGNGLPTAHLYKRNRAEAV